MKSIAIIGAGLSGITLAKQLQGVADVTVFEKSRGFGGRMATRHYGPHHFNHGAAFFTARSKLFQQYLQPLIADNVVALWEPKVITLEAGLKRFKREWFEPHYIAVPGMNALCKALALNINVRLQCEVLGVERVDAGWQLTDKAGNSLGQFDWVVSAVPAPQATTLLPECFALNQPLKMVTFSPCFCVMLGFESSLSLHFEAAVVKNSPVGWIAVGDSKINGYPGHTLVLHSDNNWARSHFDRDLEQVGNSLFDSLQELLGASLPAPVQLNVHRWRYAKTHTPAAVDFLLDTENQLAACGEWCRGDRVEDAFLSGLELGKDLQQLL